MNTNTNAITGIEELITQALNNQLLQLEGLLTDGHKQHSLLEEIPELGIEIKVTRDAARGDRADCTNIPSGSAPPPPTRTHSTPLLDLLDELSLEFWEHYEGGVQPKNEMILAYIRCKYGDWTKGECNIPGASTIVFKQMCNMMRGADMRNCQ